MIHTMKVGIHMGYAFLELGIRLDTAIAIFGIPSISTTGPDPRGFIRHRKGTRCPQDPCPQLEEKKAGSGADSERRCHTCGKKGHLKKDSPSNKNKHRKSDPSGKDQSGKGKDKG